MTHRTPYLEGYSREYKGVKQINQNKASDRAAVGDYYYSMTRQRRPEPEREICQGCFESRGAQSVSP